MKRSLSLVLVLTVGVLGALTACSKPSSDSLSEGDPAADVDSAAISTDDATGDTTSDENLTASAELSPNQSAYIDEVKSELDSFDEKIQALSTENLSEVGSRRLTRRYEAAQAALIDLESAGSDTWKDSKREMRRALARLNRVYEKVEAGEL